MVYLDTNRWSAISRINGVVIVDHHRIQIKLVDEIRKHPTIYHVRDDYKHDENHTFAFCVSEGDYLCKVKEDSLLVDCVATTHSNL